MLIRRAPRFTSNDVTPEQLYLNRREWIAGAAAAALLPGESAAATPPGPPLKAARNEALSLKEPPTKFESATTYNNFYEFGVNKDDPARLAHTLRPRPWALQVDGLVHKPKTFDVDELIRLHPLEERVYALRCVEAWSMVIPWIGFPLASLLRRGFSSLDWPYVEGLRLDEALHPLTLLTVGMYGQVLPNPNGAPIRVVVPWKYGFKSGKSIVRIRLVADEPKTAWNKAAPQEYGFYSNVNPEVSHPRWSQATERRIGEFRRRPTLMFNGYADQVAHLYAGMDLRKSY